MNFKIICVGKVKEKYFNNMIEDYVRKIEKKHNLEIISKNDENIPKNPSEAEKRNIVNLESRRIEESIERNDFVIALCIDGKKCTTKELSHVIKNTKEKGYDKVTFLIGGSLGMSDELIKKANYKLSFSLMTFPHQLMRVMLLDQIAKL